MEKKWRERERERETHVHKLSDIGSVSLCVGAWIESSQVSIELLPKRPNTW